jgi:hypothetical protein
MVLSTSLVFNSCSKEEYFDGQTWVGESFKDQDNYKYDITLAFTGNQVNATIKWKDSSGSSGSFKAKGTYTYDKKNVRINVENDDEKVDDTWSGKVDKKTMTLNVVIDSWRVDEQVVFTKQ